MRSFTFMNLKFKFFIYSLFVIYLSSCNRNSGGSDFALLEAGGKGTDPACKIISKRPEKDTFKVASTAGVLNQFIVQTNAESCKAEYLINDVAVTSTGLIADIDSANFKPGSNVVKVNVKNDTGTESFEWTVTKNNPPTCNSQSPTNLSPSVAAGSELQLTVQGQDMDGESLQFAWKYNGSKNDTLLVPIISSPTASQISFRPQPENGGTQNVKAEISDGYDTVSCSWTPKVSGDCSITTKVPDVAGNNIRILSTGSAQNGFSVSTVTAGCEVSWTLNGVPLTGKESSKILNSSIFAIGNNILSASVTGATGQSSQTWTVVKNSPPSCGVMTPSNLSTQTIGISQNLSLSLTSADLNSDPLTFSWKLNGQSVATSILSPANSGNTANASFIPTSPQVGANSIGVEISDGYESTTCSWPVQVLPACDISSSSPDHLTNRRFAGSTAQTISFSLTPNFPGYCTVNWAIDGTNVGTGTLYNLVSTNALLSSGTNHTLVATVSNGLGSTVTRTWNLVKNSPPACGVLNPSSTTLSMTQGSGSQVFQSTVVDSDVGDTFNFSWKLNGAASASLLNLGNTSSLSSSQFTPTIGNVGNNIVSLYVDDGYDSIACSWAVTVTGDCTLTSFAPSNATTIKIKANDVVGSLYSITTSTAGCPVSWSINGTPISGTTSFKSFASGDFSTGNNILQASVSNGATTTTTTWSIKRNSLPTAVQAPSASGILNLSINTDYNFSANTTDVDSDPLTITWKINGTDLASLSPPITHTTLSSVNPFQERFNFSNSYTGSRTVTASINDGTDTVDFNWDSMVFNNCLVSSSFPSGATQRVSVQNNITTTYGVIPNDSGCLISWQLNGTPVGSGNLYDLASLNGALGATNTLEATLSNGVGVSATRTWSIVKNTPPSCLSGQTPAATGNELLYTSSLALSCSATDAENDVVSFSWKLNNAYPELFSGISSSGYTSSATLNPTIGVLGSGQSVTSNFYDGWDTGFCQWNVNIKDPATVQIQACTPVQGTVTLLSQYSSTPTYDIKTFTVSATGPDITYRWKENGTILSGLTAAQAKVSTNSTDTYTSEIPDHVWAIGTRSLVVEVIDKYSNIQTCTWSLKRNRPPQINTAAAGTSGTGIQMWLDTASFTPSGNIKMNYASSLQVKIYGTDQDSGDPANLQYYWKLNGQQLPSGGDSFIGYTVAGDKSYSTATISPNYDETRLGNLTLTAVISDGAETVEQTWTININMFSTECNTLFSASVSAKGGQVCTLVGQAGVGADRLPEDDMTKMRFQPWDFALDGNNILFTDYNSNAVFYYNRGTTSGDDVTRFGKIIPHGKIGTISGAGASGLTPNMLLSTDPFKLNGPRQIAYYGGRAYVADITNHRVVVIKEDGVSESFVGRVSDNAIASNVTAANSTTGSVGTSQMCYDASGLKVVNESGTIYLYMGCRHSIKKVNITNPSDLVNYGKTYLVVGKLGPGGVLGDGWENGDPIQEARTSRPRAIDIDNNNNIYWTEHEGRLRVFNRGATSLSFFSGRSTSSSTTFVATDYVNSGGSITGLSTSGKLQAVNASLNVATKVVINGPSNGATSYVGNGHCIPLRIQLQNAGNLASIFGSDVGITMSAAPANVNFYANEATCLASGALTTNYTLTTGQREIEVWAKSTTNSTYTLTATATGVTSGTLSNYTVATPTATTQKILVASSTNSFHFQDCTRVWITPANASNAPASPTAGTQIRFYAQNGGNFYAKSDTTCSGTPIDSLTYSGGATSYSEGFVNFARTTIVPAGKVGTLYGNPATIGGNSQAYLAGSAGIAQFRIGYGLAVNYSGSNILGFFISGWDYHITTYINNNDSSGGTTLTQSIGGTSLGANAASTGLYHEQKAIAGVSGSGTFNGDSKTGVNSRFYNVAGVMFDSTKDYLLFGDVSNWRMRKMRVTSGADNSILGTLVGSGRAKFGWYGDAPVPATDAVFEQPTDIIFESSSSSLFISDMRNGRIRKVNLLKGSFETYLGRGRGDMTVPSEDQFAMLLGGPQQMTLYKKTGATPMDFLLFADSTVSGNNVGAGANITCAIRAFNRDPSLTKTIFGEDVQSQKINNIVGDYSLGCQGSITLNQTGLNSALNNPVGLVNDGTNLYVSDFSNHCIVKIDPTNTVSNFIGRCGTAGSADGVSNGDNTTNSTLLTYPMQMVMDPMNAGNFFFTEGHNQSIGKIHYANTGAAQVSFAAGNAIGKGAGIVGTSTLWSIAPASTTARINGIAAFSSKWVCVTSGGTISNSHWLDPNTGGHGVYCFDRGDSLGNMNRIVGSNPSNANRGGSSLGLEHELKPGTSVQLNQPHGIAFDDDGNLYISERGSHVIRMVRRWW